MLRNLLTYLRKKFHFSETEIRGMLVLLPVTIVIAIVPNLTKRWLTHDFVRDKEDIKLLEEWYAETQTIAKTPNDEKPKSIAYFNPNKITIEQWVDMGFSKKVAQRIINYRQKGGQFRVKEDLLKIYGINQALALNYLPYIIIHYKPQRKTSDVPIPTKPMPIKKKKIIKISLNTADTSAFQTIRGIGSYWSNRIVKFRNALGGFVDKNQLYEIYGMEKELAQWIIEHSTFEADSIRQLSINQNSIKILSKHPYISYRTAKAIVNYGKQHGKYTSVEQIKSIVTISDSLYYKISPYLTISP